MILHRSSREIRTLVVHTGGIGDFLLFCPCLKRLAEDGPVELAGNDRDRLNLAVVSGLAVTTHLLDEFEFGSVFGERSPRFDSFAARFERVIIWMNDLDGGIRKAFRAVGVRDVHAFAGLPPASWKRHASAYYAECLGLGDLPPLLLAFEADEGTHDVLVHAGSGSARKNWPIDRFAMVASELVRRCRAVEWIRGPAEEKLPIPLGTSVLEVASIVTLARHLSNTRLYIGNDSGVTHLAAACGCRVVAVFGPTNPRVWAPRGEHVRVVRRRDWPETGDVLKAIGKVYGRERTRRT